MSFSHAVPAAHSAPQGVPESVQYAARASVAWTLGLTIDAIAFPDAWRDIEVYQTGWFRFREVLEKILPDQDAPLCMYDVTIGRPCIRAAGHPVADQYGFADGHRTHV